MVAPTQAQFFTMRDLFRRDYASKYYSTIPFALSMVLMEIPYLIAIGTLTFVGLYWSAGLETDAISGFYIWIMVCLILFFGISFGQVIAYASSIIFIIIIILIYFYSSAVPNMIVAFIFLPFIDSFLFLFSGLLVPYPYLPTFWRVSIQWFKFTTIIH